MTDSTPTTQTQPANRLIFSANKVTQQQLIMGILLIIMGIFALAITGAAGGAPIGFGVLCIIMSFLLNSNEYIILDADCIGVKMGIKSRVNVLFSEITSIERAKKKITLFYKIHGEDSPSTKKLVVALNIMDDKEGFIEAFNKRCDK